MLEQQLHKRLPIRVVAKRDGLGKRRQRMTEFAKMEKAKGQQMLRFALRAIVANALRDSIDDKFVLVDLVESARGIEPGERACARARAARVRSELRRMHKARQGYKLVGQKPTVRSSSSLTERRVAASAGPRALLMTARDARGWAPSAGQSEDKCESDDRGDARVDWSAKCCLVRPGEAARVRGTATRDSISRPARVLSITRRASFISDASRVHAACHEPARRVLRLATQSSATSRRRAPSSALRD